jgi:tRNA threonylcarbamoyladenosine biosynthesis protein TsaE
MNYREVELKDLEKISKEIVNIILSSAKERDSFVIYLEGDMGAGKTTLAQNIGKSLGITDHMQSPTFTLMREYDLPSEVVIKDIKINIKYKKLIHIDAYRFEDKKEGQVLRLNENKKGNIVLIEWQNNMHAPDADMIISIEKVSEGIRNIKIETIEFTYNTLNKK